MKKIVRFLLNLISYFLRPMFERRPIRMNDGESNSFHIHERLNELIEGFQKLYSSDLLDGEVLIARGNEKILNLRSRAIENNINDGSSPQFMIGSISKQFFAVALLKALYASANAESDFAKVAKVKKQLQDTVSDFLPHSSDIWDGSPPKWIDRVTVHQLLTHTSGIPNSTDCAQYDKSKGGKKFYEVPRTKSEIIQLISKKNLLFKPGSSYSYSNTEYVLIAAIIEVLTGMKASEYLKKELFIPLELNSTFNPEKGIWPVLKETRECSNLVPECLYDPTKKNKTYPLPHHEDLSTAIGSGSIISTTGDLLKWNLDLHKYKIVLPQSLYQLFITPYKEDYGYGINILERNCGLVYQHEGYIDAFKSYLLYIPHYDLSIIYLSNITYDWEKVEDEYEEFYNEYQNKNLSDEKCDEKATNKIYKKYPGDRGYISSVDMIDSFID